MRAVGVSNQRSGDTKSDQQPRKAQNAYVAYLSLIVPAKCHGFAVLKYTFRAPSVLGLF